MLPSAYSPMVFSLTEFEVSARQRFPQVKRPSLTNFKLTDLVRVNETLRRRVR
jgi:hypothetical protein